MPTFKGTSNPATRDDEAKQRHRQREICMIQKGSCKIFHKNLIICMRVFKMLSVSRN
jgi:hypothetical protein